MSENGSKPKRTRAEAARENGKKGGRPKKFLDPSPFDHIGPCPANPIKRGHWIQSVLLADMAYIISATERTEAEKERSRDLRALGSVAIKAGPLDSISKAVELVSGDSDDLADEAGPDEELVDDVEGAMVK